MGVRGLVVASLAAGTVVGGVVLATVLGGEEPADRGDVRVREVAENPRAHLGKRVSLTGRLAHVLDQQLVIVRGVDADTEFVAVQTPRPVVSPDSPRAPVQESLVKLRGTVAAADLLDVRRDFGELPEEAREVLPETPLVRASEFGLTPYEPPPGDALRIPPGEVVAEVDRRAGESVKFQARVSEVHTERAVSVGPLLVVSDVPQMSRLEKGDFVQVVGEVQRFDRERAERRLRADLDRRLARFEGRPSVRAVQVRYATPLPYRDSDGDPRLIR